MRDFINFYTQQSVITELHEYANIFEELPSDIVTLVQIVNNFMLLDSDATYHKFVIPSKNLDEINQRDIYSILSTAFLKHHSTLYVERDITQKVIGTCRDMAVLLCSLLRTKKIAARVRYGFRKSKYSYYDHTIVEYYDEKKEKLTWVDPCCLSELHRKNRRVNYDMYNVTRQHYVTGADAWYECINNDSSPEQFGVGALMKIRGLWFVRNKMLQDFASLNKIEVLPWDEWGIMHSSMVENNTLFILEDIANTIINAGTDTQKLKDVYEKYLLIQIPNKIENSINNNIIHFRNNLLTNTLIYS